MCPLCGQSLLVFQEEMRDVKYLLIDEFSFVGPKLLLKIDSRLREAFPHQQKMCFGGTSIILVGDLAQLPPVMDKPIYASHSNAKYLWEQFTMVITLTTIFRQQGDTQIQIDFRRMLKNMRNADSTEQDWELLMQRTNKTLCL
jgi:hypothetical protein